MRHPRITGHNEPIYKITLDDGSIIRVTANHKFLTTDKEYILSIDDPLTISTQNFATGVSGQAYAQTLQAAGGYGNYAWSVVITRRLFVR